MEHETLIRLTIFVGLFVIIALIETFIPRRQRGQKRQQRWATNWAFTFANFLLLRVLATLMPLLAVGAAIDANTHSWGILNMMQMPVWIEVIIAILVLDFAIWAQHLITHKVPLLWRIHSVHHADTDMDVSTAIRFHPIEIGLSMILKITLVYLLGPSVIAIILFEIILNGTAMFNHANIRLPLPLDIFLRKILVTPDMHRIHHSAQRTEHDNNYGFALSIWDHMFGTYISEPAMGHEHMQVGLEWQDDRPSKFVWSLLLPFMRK